MSDQKSFRAYLKAKWAILQSQKKRHMPRNAAIGALTTGIIAAFGILSVAGAILINPAVGALMAAFIFGGMAEGEVYFEEIKEGIKDIALVGRRGKRLLIARYLRRTLKNRQVPAQGLIEDYEKTRRYLKELEGKVLTPAQREDKAFALERLRMMEDYLVDRVMSDADKDNSENEADTEIIETLRQHKQKITIKMWVMRSVLPLTVVLGGAFTFAMGGVFSLGLPALGLAASAALVGPLAVVAGIGIVFLMIHTAKEVMFSDWFYDWKERLRDWLKGEMTPKQILKMIVTGLALVLVTALCIAAVILNTITFWAYMQQGISLTMHLTNTVKWVANSMTLLYNAGQFVFSMYKSLESVQSIMSWLEKHNILEAMYDKTIGFIKNVYHTENLFQCLDPFRLTARTIQKLANAVMLLGHVTASGMAGDRTSLMSPQLASAVNGGNEFTQDLPFFNKEGNEKTLTERFVTAVVSPLLFLSSVWQFAGSQWNVDKPKLHFGEAFMNAFQLTMPQHTEKTLPRVSNTWQNKEIRVFFEKEKKRLGKTIGGDAKSKLKALDNVEANLRTGQGAFETDQARATLNKHRLFATTKPTRSAGFVDKMKHYYAPQSMATR